MKPIHDSPNSCIPELSRGPDSLPAKKPENKKGSNALWQNNMNCCVFVCEVPRANDWGSRTRLQVSELRVRDGYDPLPRHRLMSKAQKTIPFSTFMKPIHFVLGKQDNPNYCIPQLIFFKIWGPAFCSLVWREVWKATCRQKKRFP